jgi:hypothetical protein
MQRSFGSVDEYLAQTVEISTTFGAAFAALDDSECARLRDQVAQATRPFTDVDGTLALPGSSLVASAAA